MMRTREFAISQASTSAGHTNESIVLCSFHPQRALRPFLPIKTRTHRSGLDQRKEPKYAKAHSR